MLAGTKSFTHFLLDVEISNCQIFYFLKYSQNLCCLIVLYIYVNKINALTNN